MRATMMMRLAKGASLLVLLAGVTACGSARRGVPVAPPLADEPPPAVQQGHIIYDRYCNSCHPGGTAGIGPAINNKPLPDATVRFQVRNGIGAMPAFGEDVISDEELDLMLTYLGWLADREPVPELVDES